MSDKPLVQQALAETLGSLVLDIPSDNAIPFVKAFWEIHCNEWHGLDRIRYDGPRLRLHTECSVLT